MTVPVQANNVTPRQATLLRAGLQISRRLPHQFVIAGQTLWPYPKFYRRVKNGAFVDEIRIFGGMRLRRHAGAVPTHRLICRGYTDVVDADLSKYFDTIPHSDLLSVARRIVDRHVLWLIRLWLKAPVEERDGEGTRRISGGKGNKRGTPQGGVASPVALRLYMNRSLKHWRLTGRGEAFRAQVVSYADDFVILSRGFAHEVLAWTRAVMTKLGLTLNETKTSVRNARSESFDFLESCVLCSLIRFSA